MVSVRVGVGAGVGDGVVVSKLIKNPCCRQFACCGPTGSVVVTILVGSFFVGIALKFACVVAVVDLKH